MTEGFTTDFTEMDSCMVIIKNVPCQKCGQCGETVISGVVHKRIESIVYGLKDSLMEVAIVKYSDTAA
jgi:YgiT-type zinc finger domain-containing protein